MFFLNIYHYFFMDYTMNFLYLTKPVVILCNWNHGGIWKAFQQRYLVI